MSTQIQRRRGTTAEHSTFTGVEGEITVDTTKDTAVVHDGTTVGGHPLQKQYPPLGSAAAPTYTFTGDPNTGIYSPGADQVAVATNGSGKIFIAADGKLGVLTASPATALDVAGGISGTGALNISGGGWSILPYVVNSLVVDSISGQTRLFATGTDASTHGNMLFFTGTTNGTAAERLRITSAGLVGIGTSAPVSGAQLTVAGAALAVTGQNLNHSANSIRIGQEGSGAAQIRCYGPNTSTNGSLTFKMSRSDGANSQDVVIDGSGRLGIGTSTPATVVDIEASADAYITIQPGTTDGNVGLLINNSAGTQKGVILYDTDDNYMLLSTENTERMRIDSSGRVGIGTQSPATSLHLLGANTPARGQLSVAGNGDDARITFYRDSAFIGGINADTTNGVAIAAETGYSITFNPGGTSEKGRFDSSGRLLVGTSTTSKDFSAVFQGNSADATGGANLLLARGTSSPADGSAIGYLSFTDSNHNTTAQIQAQRDGGTWTSGTSQPGRLVFATTADGASSPTERMRITSGGYVLAGKTASDLSVAGFQVAQTGQTDVTVNNSECMNINRNTSDGSLIRFFQDNTFEGSISVSGTTVSYNGAHLSRWSQLPSGAARTEILRGSVLANLDEMCEWGEEDNEQLNRMKVSDVEGDKNVSGVFQAWDDDDDTYTNDFYCAMTGDFIIRIGAGVTVERGDLLMSAGDGTAKPQADDAVRSCTVAKVTSTHVSHTHPDGSYCVPCVLMAC
jgi:hypothetical protein